MKKRLILPIIAILAVSSGCSQPAASKAPEEAKKAKVVEIIKIAQQQQPIMLTKSGVVQAKQEVKLAFGTSGKIISLPVKKGMQVKAGQVLGALDTSAYQSSLALSSAQIQEAQIKRAKILKGDSKVTDTYDNSMKQTDDSLANTEDAIKKQKIKIENDNQTLNQDKTDLQRNEALFASGAVSRVEVDNLKIKVDQAELSLQSEQVQLTALEGQKKRLLEQKQLTAQQRQKAVQAEKDNTDRLASTATEVASAKNGITQANKNIQDAKITAPFSGTIAEVTPYVGDMVSPGTAVATLVDLSQIKVSVQIEPSLISQFAAGKKITMNREDGSKTTGTVTFISPLADSATGKYNVEITAPNPDGVWRGGMVANVELPRTLSTGFILPLQCLGVGDKGRYVLVAENGTVKKRMIEAGQIIGDKIEILSGINPGDQVIASGISFLLEGEKVEPKGE
ncbi:efflux RND transporter periplasmic adaptor subunit [Aneurinibacillus tyrosinisolvens]|uniref:efflux RND transporter periplasmic adaptor subunit n=1 Tax=Aneurinibacillus tyrosinisolvens TaxID=1443435 RepID=UPI00137919BF|nr:efflux RND transporter periplasmic adaptor subunit [Aneurinibacillus tyrosinisolvens]